MYTLPETLGHDIRELGAEARNFIEGGLSPAAFKIKRVPMGIYEQRRDGTYMVRVRTTGGIITPRQFISLVEIAQRLGSNLLHITTRQEIQLQNVDLIHVEEILDQLREIGLSSKGGGGNTVRNIMVTSDSGISADETFDPTPHAEALTSRLIAEKDSFSLPRKLKIAFSSSRANTDYAAVNDLGFVARIVDGRRGFKVYLGGSVASKPTVGWLLSEFVPEENLFAVAEAVKKFFSQHGNRRNKHQARLRYIFYNLGEQQALQLFAGYYASALETTPKYIAAETLRDDIDEYRSNDIGFGPGYIEWVKRYVRPSNIPGLNSVAIPIIHGNIDLSDDTNTDKLLRLLHFVARLGNDTIRFTPRQGILLRNIPTNALSGLQDLVRGFAPASEQPVLPGNVVSCTGADTCRLGICLSKGLAAAVRRKILRLPEVGRLSYLRLHISGCPNSCGQQIWADLGFSGRALRNDRLYPAYQIYAGARRGESPALAHTFGNIAARDVPDFVARLLSDYAAKAEQYPGFADYIDADGGSLIARLVEEYSEIPHFSEDKNYYYDWGADDLFTVAGRGVAECSAGIFDMIDIDKAYITQYREQLAKEIDPARLTETYYRLLFSAARMLLVTRGAEPKTDPEVFELFERYFIDAGLVDGRFRQVVRLASAGQNYPFGQHREVILALADVVDALYGAMDDSLQFKNLPDAPLPPKPPLRTDTPPVERRFKDLRGVACPMNFVQTKIILSQMKSGELLEILLDDGPPVANVPGSVRGEGHGVEEPIRIENHWRVLIRKK